MRSGVAKYLYNIGLQFFVNSERFISAVKHVYNGHHKKGLKKMTFIHKWLLCTGCSYKIGIKFEKSGIRLVVVERLLLFRGGR
jgi:hypothetical protein